MFWAFFGGLVLGVIIGFAISLLAGLVPLGKNDDLFCDPNWFKAPRK